MAIGDSLTIGAPGTTGGYRAPLFASNPAMNLVGTMWLAGYHEGYNGFRIDQISPSVLPFVDIYTPSMIILMAGTNDIAQGQSAASTLTELMAFVAALKAKASVDWVLVCTIPTMSTFVAESAAYNAGILGTVPPAGTVIVDASGTLIFPADFVDALHPTDAGYAKIALGMDAAVAAILPM